MTPLELLEQKADQAQTLRLAAARREQQQWGRARLMDSRDQMGARLRLWDVAAASPHALSPEQRDAIARRLLARFPEVLWVSGPAAGVVWCVPAQLAQLPAAAAGWEGTPVGVWLRGEATGWKAQTRLTELFASFVAAHYLGTCAPRSSFGSNPGMVLLTSLERVFGSFRKDRTRKHSPEEREVALFLQLWTQWRSQKTASRFQDEPAQKKRPRSEGDA